MAGPPIAPANGPEAQPSPNGHRPYVPDDARIPEFTWPAVLVGAVLGIVFGASSLYLVLNVGMTVSASIPVAVMSITLFRLFSRLTGFRRATILENNIVQTAGSAGESIAFGVGVTMPALMLLGYEMDVTRVMVVAVLGGILGILMMIPLRRAFIVKQHGTLRYPEGTACADVLIVGEQGGASAKTVFAGFGVAFVYEALRQGLKLWKETPSRAIDWFTGAEPSMDVNPTLLGVGYIIGTRIAAIMMAGAVLAYFVLVPTIRYFGDGLQQPLEPGTTLIRDMDVEAIRGNYVLYVGAGAVATGGVISLFRALPLILGSLVAGVRDLRGSLAGAGTLSRRTDRDLSLVFVGVGSLVLVLVLWAVLPVGGLWLSWVSLAGALLIVLFGFLFVTVSSRLTGEIGSSSNPISGMTVATLLLTCLIFLACDWTSSAERVMALSVAAVVCVASSNGGTTSQDLKTGYLVGAMPKYQQWAIIVGAITSAVVIGWILLELNRAGTVWTNRPEHLPTPLHPPAVASLPDLETVPDDESHTPYHVWRVGESEARQQGIAVGKYLLDDQGKIRWLVDPGINGRVTRRDNGIEVRKFSPPQPKLFALITDGILTRKLPWTLVLLGVSIAVVLELARVPSLPFAVGVYLPFSVSSPVFVGGLIRWAVERWGPHTEGQTAELEAEMSPGVLMSTGYIAGGAIAGVLIAFLSFNDDIPRVLSTWQYSRYTLDRALPIDEAYRAAAEDAWRGAKAPSEQKLKARATEIQEMNESQFRGLAPLSKGKEILLPGDRTYRADADTTLGEVARAELGSAGKAPSLFDLNRERVSMPRELPAGTELKVPQRNWPALFAFGALASLLVLVGMGWWLKPEPNQGACR